MASVLDTPQKLLKVDEVAERLRVSIWSVYRRIEAGEIPAVRIGAGPRSPIRVDARELERWIYSPQISLSPQVQVVAATDGSAKAAATVEPSVSQVEA